jgi:type 1 glutamine amidotransferase
MKIHFSSLRNLVKTILILSTVMLLLSNKLLATSGKESETPSLKGKKVLFIWGGWDGHEPKQSVDIFVPWMRSEGAEVIVSETLDSYLDTKLMESLDLIVQVWTMGKITSEQEKGLLNAVKNGTGLAGWHGGLGDSFRENTE